MKKFFICIILSLVLLNIKAEYFKFISIEVVQPDKSVLQCYASGDEFYHWMHDSEGFTIIQNEIDGFYYYAVKDGELLKPSLYRVGSINPFVAGITPWLKIPPVKYMESKSARAYIKSAKGVTNGTLTNIVIFVRFKNDDEFTKTRQVFNDMLNEPTTVSMKAYYNEVSYGKLSVESNQYPICALTTNLSYVDINERGYYSPYNAVTNTIGYVDDSGNREQSLVERVINAVKAEIPSNMVIDADNDGYVDNVTIVVRGNADGWGKLLWPHQWWLYMKTAYINSKQVGNYIFITENMFDAGTMCHEMFHVVGAPDLYHYTDNGIDPIGPWSGHLSHVTAYMKWKYSKREWISNIPEITVSGNYSLKPLTSSTNNCYKIKSPYSSTEFYTLEFRKKQGLFEGTIPSTGMVITRINSLANGNGNGPPDEVYVCRPQGTPFNSGDVNGAIFTMFRNSFNANTNPRPFLSDGTNAGIDISKVSVVGDSVTFHVEIIPQIVQKSSWVVKTDSYENGTAFDPGTNATDDSPTTIWHTPWSNTTTYYPHWIEINFGKLVNIRGFNYLPRQDMENGRIKDFEFFTSADGLSWTSVVTGSFANSKDIQTYTFSERNCKYAKLLAKNEVNGKAFASLAELSFIFNTPSISKTNWTLLNASSFETSYDPKLAYDGNGKTFWRTKTTSPSASYPHELAINLGETYCIESASYLPRQDGSIVGNIGKYEFYASTDGNNWKLLNKGQLTSSAGEKVFSFPKTVCRYVKIVAVSEVNSGTVANICEISVWGAKSSDLTAPLAPTNFRVASRSLSTLKLMWDKDPSDNNILNYKVFSSDTIIGLPLPNYLDVLADTTKTYLFKIVAIDGSGNISDTAKFSYNVATSAVVIADNSLNPKVYSSANTIYLSNLNGYSTIKVFSSMGKEIGKLNTVNPQGEIKVENYHGIAVVTIFSGNTLVMHQKVYLD